ncbi:hypothetical protein [Microbulbifer sp. SAOS-129_SWC]|uniref:hypothetical protein n=1 Tax=Microbulbifer sp. SAOS-129_SWC TaxID=3145235 RepID=UPI003217BCCE
MNKGASKRGGSTARKIEENPHFSYLFVRLFLLHFPMVLLLLPGRNFAVFTAASGGRHHAV